jgi:tRNA pseudouridine38-40 synthase
MPRYFIELAYKGTDYSGFQIQENAVTVQSEVENALQTFLRKKINLTGSSRTDTGVHALQNFFHFDDDSLIAEKEIYHLNSILPQDIAIKNIYSMNENCHCRFDAVAREYKYYISQNKNPFYTDRAWFYPYKLNIDLLKKSAETILMCTNFTS